ncbi:MarR family winged helix-turn-helix transcriptional regulator [Microbacterium halophytorum]|uniref:MarR family winged helix-turn-helix transcriptional regulator n=1 Tax=Microbacterium halophytorum TaxID=2067568 RepID=UPI000CFDB265|nr:MarR family transcriptional regulator [Microbacterium halophytorum]
MGEAAATNDAPSIAQFRNLQDAIGRATSAVAQRLELSVTDAAAIEHIALASRAVGPGELAARLAVTRSSATEIVDRLVESGYIHRVRDERDRRRFRLEPTKFATDRVRELLDPLVRSIVDVTAKIPPRDRELIDRYLGEVTSAYRAFADDATAATEAVSSPDAR